MSTEVMIFLHADKATASVTTNYGTNHEATATDTDEAYEVTIEATSND